MGTVGTAGAVGTVGILGILGNAEETMSSSVRKLEIAGCRGYPMVSDSILCSTMVILNAHLV